MPPQRRRRGTRELTQRARSPHQRVPQALCQHGELRHSRRSQLPLTRTRLPRSDWRAVRSQSARLLGGKQQPRLDLDCNHVAHDALHQRSRVHVVLKGPYQAGGPVGGGLQQHATLGPVDARLDAEEHVDDEVVRKRVLRVGSDATPLVAWVDPQPNALAASPSHALCGHEIALEVTP
eukprot:3675939-Rhodomonas_salina.1